MANAILNFHFDFLTPSLTGTTCLGGFPKVRANSDVQAGVGDGNVATLDVQQVERDTTLGHLTRQQSNLFLYFLKLLRNVS